MHRAQKPRIRFEIMREARVIELDIQHIELSSFARTARMSLGSRNSRCRLVVVGIHTSPMTRTWSISRFALDDDKGRFWNLHLY